MTLLKKMIKGPNFLQLGKKPCNYSSKFTGKHWQRCINPVSSMPGGVEVHSTIAVQQKTMPPMRLPMGAVIS